MIIFNFETNFNFKNKLILKNWIKFVINNYNKKVGDISYIFVDDEKLLEINIQYLNHNYYTDIITFDYTENNKISGDLFISLDRINENAINLNISFKYEFLRVVIHGVLHLLGFNDSTEDEKQNMRNLEEKYIYHPLLNDFVL
jgi:rRNA maturation RNase YbeY